MQVIHNKYGLIRARVALVKSLASAISIGTGAGIAATLNVPLGGLAPAGFIKALYWSEDKFDDLHDSYYLRHILGMFCVGVMLYLMIELTGKYYIQGTGDATLADILTRALSDTWFLLLLCVLKVISTCLSLGSGASVGVFSPSLFIGATLGAAFSCVTEWDVASPNTEILLFAAAGIVAMVAGT